MGKGKGQKQSQLCSATAAAGGSGGGGNGSIGGGGAASAAAGPAILAPAKTLHADAVNAISFGESPWTIITGGQDKTVAVYEWSKKSTSAQWAAHDRGVTQVIYSTQAKCLFTASRDATIAQWSMDGTQQQTFAGHDMAVTGIAVNPRSSGGGGGVLASGARNGDVFIWDVESGKRLRKQHITRNVVTALKWVPTTETFAQTSEDKILRLWDARTLKVAQEYPRQQYFPCGVDCSKDGNLVLTGSNGFDGHGCYVSLWDTRKGEKVLDMQGHTQRVTSACFLQAPDRQLAATAGIDGSIRMWDTVTGECLAESVHPDIKFNALAPVSGPGGVTNLAAATASGLVYVFALRGGSTNALQAGQFYLKVLALY